MNKPLSISENFSELTEFGHRIQQCVMPIFAIKNGLPDGEVISLGTGFIVGPNGHMLTAAHVVGDAIELLNSADRSTMYEIFALYVTDKRHGPNDELYLGGPIPITHMWHVPELDIACLSLQPIVNIETQEMLTFPVMRLDVGEPLLDTQTLAFGYYEGKTQIAKASTAEQIVADYAQRTAFTRGKITELYPDYKYEFPCFTTNSKIEPGMSGSPILNEQGDVCGLVSSSMPALSDDESHTSFCSMIWPALGISIDTLDESTGRVIPKTIYELTQQGYITATGLEKVSISKEGERTTVALRKD